MLANLTMRSFSVIKRTIIDQAAHGHQLGFSVRLLQRDILMDKLNYPSGPLARAFAMIRYVASQKKSLSVAEISDALELPVPTAHRLITNLESMGYLQRVAGSKRVMVGSALLELGSDSIASAFSVSSVYGLLQKASAKIGEQCEISIVRHGTVEYIASVKSESFMGLQFDAGKQGPLHCTSTGKIYLSTLKDPVLHRIVASLPLRRFTPNTITEPEQLLEEVTIVREQGWAATNEEYVLGVVGCGVPIPSKAGGILACLGISVPSARVPFERLASFIPQMKYLADELSDQILYTDG